MELKIPDAATEDEKKLLEFIIGEFVTINQITLEYIFEELQRMRHKNIDDGKARQRRLDKIRKMEGNPDYW